MRIGLTAAAAEVEGTLFRQEGEYWTVVFDGSVGRLRDAKGLRHLARLNATRAIRAAVANLARDNPGLGRHLAATIRTGRSCAYLPDPRAPIAWNADPGHRPPGLNTGAPALNAHSADEGSARRRSRGARSRRPWEAAAVLIRLWIEGSQPLAGTAATEGSEPVRFDGWLELLRVVAELSPWRPRAPRTRTRLDDPTEEGGHAGDQTGQESRSTGLEPQLT